MSKLEEFVADIQSYHYLAFPVADYSDAVIQHRHCYSVAFSKSRRMAIWCAYCVTLRDILGANVLDRNFHRELDEELTPSEYQSSGYDMGHLCPLASYRGNLEAAETNAMTNIIPQSPDLNRGPWLKLENKVRDISENNHECWVVALPVWEKQKGPKIGEVRVPDAIGKVICWFDEFKNMHLSAYLLPQSAGRKDDPQQYLTTLENLVELTGVRPFGHTLPVKQLTKKRRSAK